MSKNGNKVYKECPRCGVLYPDWDCALSRRDNATSICSQCGTEEALLDYFGDSEKLRNAGIPELSIRRMLDQERRFIASLRRDFTTGGENE